MDQLSNDEIYEICQHMDLETLKRFTLSSHRMVEICSATLKRRQEEESILKKKQYLKKIIFYHALRANNIDVSYLDINGYGIRAINNINPSSRLVKVKGNIYVKPERYQEMVDIMNS